MTHQPSDLPDHGDSTNDQNRVKKCLIFFNWKEIGRALLANARKWRPE
jgi:hypothetical protein